MNVDFNDINKFKDQISFDKDRDNKSLTVKDISKVETSHNNSKLSSDDSKSEESVDRGFANIFDKSLDKYR